MKNDKGRLTTGIQYGDSYIHSNSEPCTLVCMCSDRPHPTNTCHYNLPVVSSLQLLFCKWISTSMHLVHGLGRATMHPPHFLTSLMLTGNPWVCNTCTSHVFASMLLPRNDAELGVGQT